MVPFHVVDGFPVVLATVGARPVTFILDTGAQAHLVLPAAQALLRLPVLPGSVPMLGTGGATAAPIVSLVGVRLGSVLLEPAPTPVAPLPLTPRVDPILIGLLGASLLDRFDLELDAAAGRAALFDAGTCMPTWRGAAVALTVTPDRQLLLPVTIDGVRLTALLDTGSRATLLTEAAARRLGLAAPPSANTARGVDGGPLGVAHTRVRVLEIGLDVSRDVPVSVADLQLGGADLLLGMDYLRQRRVWVSGLSGVLRLDGLGPGP